MNGCEERRDMIVRMGKRKENKIGTNIELWGVGKRMEKKKGDEIGRVIKVKIFKG